METTYFYMFVFYFVHIWSNFASLLKVVPYKISLFGFEKRDRLDIFKKEKSDLLFPWL